MRVELRLAGADEQRQRIEDVDRPVRHDRPGDERDRVLPGEDDRRRHRRAAAASQFAEAVGREEERVRGRRARRRRGATAAPPVRRGQRHRRRSAHAAPPIRSASDTVKMPHSSMRCSELAEAGGGDELVHLGLRAPAHDPGLAAAMAGQRARDQFELRVPGLAGIDQIAARRDRGGQPGERARAPARCPGNSS